MKYRSDRVDGKEKTEGNLLYLINMLDGQGKPAIQEYTQRPSSYDFFSPEFGCNYVEVVETTLEIFIFGEWRLVSELETKYNLIEKSEEAMIRARFKTISEV